MLYNTILTSWWWAYIARHQEVKIVLYSIWYHHTETSELSKITKIQFHTYEHIVVKFMYEFLGVITAYYLLHITYYMT